MVKPRQAFIASPGNIVFRDVATPEPHPGRASARVKRIGACGSDIHVYHGKHALTLYPVVQGHEISGVVGVFGDMVRMGKVKLEPLVTNHVPFADYPHGVPLHRGQPRARHDGHDHGRGATERSRAKSALPGPPEETRT